MLRLIHAHNSLGSILVDDIDDGLPNKTAHRLGSTGNPDAYLRDGYANASKQPCYVPYWKPQSATISGYIDLRETERVELSAGKGKIQGLFAAGLILAPVSFTAADVAAPTVASAVIGGGPADVTITGTNLTSLTPNFTTVYITGTGGPLTITQDDIITAGGSVAALSIVIPAALVVGVATITSFARVVADDLSSGTPVALS